MKKTKLIDKLKLLQKDELNDFGRFINSSYYNKNKDAVKLFTYLKDYHPVYASKKLDKDYVINKLFFDWKESSDRKLTYLTSILIELIDKFIAFKEIEYDKHENYQLLLKAYKRRQGNKFFDVTVKSFQRDLEISDIRDTNHYFHQYRLNQEAYMHNATQRIEIGIESLENAVKYLDLFYFSIKLRYSCEIYSRQLILSEKSELILLDNILKTVECHSLFKDEPLIQIFSTIIHLYQTREGIVYKKLKKLIFNNIDQFDFIEQRDIITFANNFCITEWNKGEVEYLNEMFEWYEYGLVRGIYITEEKMEYVTFDNIVAIACKLDKFEWTERFIKTHSKYLVEDIEQSVKTMAWCHLEFSRDNFDEVLKLLNPVEFIDSQYKMNADSYILRCYYEVDGYEEVFYNKCESFARRCRRDKIMGESRKQLILNFISIIKQIHTGKYRKISKKELFRQMDEKPSAYSHWLIKIIERDIQE